MKQDETPSRYKRQHERCSQWEEGLETETLKLKIKLKHEKWGNNKQRTVNQIERPDKHTKQNYQRSQIRKDSTLLQHGQKSP